MALVSVWVLTLLLRAGLLRMVPLALAQRPSAAGAGGLFLPSRIAGSSSRRPGPGAQALSALLNSSLLLTRSTGRRPRAR